jgi:hypothetical protein
MVDKHMQRFVQRGKWLCAETHDGTVIYAEGDFSIEQICKEFGITSDDIENKEGWCWRFSAPGYMDQYPEDGSWCGVFTTRGGAEDAADDFEDPERPGAARDRAEQECP